MYGLNNLDDKIFDRLQKLGVTSKFFIEAGANDGLSQTNTYLLEAHHGWTGILVEPNLINYQRACYNRPRSKVVRGALVSSDYSHSTIAGIFSESALNRWNGLATGVTKEHLEDFPDQVCEVPAITLTKVLQDCKAPLDIGLFSLDVENYELEVLAGLDTEVWRPHVIVMEVGKHYIEGVLAAHVDYMKSIDYLPDEDYELTDHDFIFVDARRNKNN